MDQPSSESPAPKTNELGNTKTADTNASTGMETQAAPHDTDDLTNEPIVLRLKALARFMEYIYHLPALRDDVVQTQILNRQKWREVDIERQKMLALEKAFMIELQTLVAEGQLTNFNTLLQLGIKIQGARDVVGPLEEECFEADRVLEWKFSKVGRAETRAYEVFSSDLHYTELYPAGPPSLSSSEYESSSDNNSHCFSEDLTDREDDPRYQQLPSTSLEPTWSNNHIHHASFSPQIMSDKIEEEKSELLNSSALEDPRLYESKSISWGAIDDVLEQPPNDRFTIPQYPIETMSSSKVRDSELLTSFGTTRERTNKWILHCTLLSRLEATILRNQLNIDGKNLSNWAQLAIAWWGNDVAATPHSTKTSKPEPKDKFAENQIGIIRVADELETTSPQKLTYRDILSEIKTEQKAYSDTQDTHTVVGLGYDLKCDTWKRSYNSANALKTEMQNRLSPSIGASSQTSWSVVEEIGGVFESATILFDQDQCKPLLLRFSESLEQETFVAELTKVLKNFSQDLRKESKNQSETETANFFRKSRFKIADDILKRICAEDSKASIDAIDSNRSKVISRAAESIENQIRPNHQPLKSLSDSATQEPESSDDEGNDENLPFSQHASAFILRSQALQRLKLRLETSIDQQIKSMFKTKDGSIAFVDLNTEFYTKNASTQELSERTPLAAVMHHLDQELYPENSSERLPENDPTKALIHFGQIIDQENADDRVAFQNLFPESNTVTKDVAYNHTTKSQAEVLSQQKKPIMNRTALEKNRGSNQIAPLADSKSVGIMSEETIATTGQAATHESAKPELTTKATEKVKKEVDEDFKKGELREYTANHKFENTSELRISVIKNTLASTSSVYPSSNSVSELVAGITENRGESEEYVSEQVRENTNLFPNTLSKLRYPRPWSHSWMKDKERSVYLKERKIATGTYQIVWSDEDHEVVMKAPPPKLSKKEKLQPEDHTNDATVEAIEEITHNIGKTSNETKSFQATVSDPQVITGSVKTRDQMKWEEKSDKNYQQHWRADFKYGRVFKVLWSEPRGSGNEGGTVISYREGNQNHEKVRRFVIIEARPSHCLCLPIMSYGGRGTAKYGVHKEDHAVIYTGSEPTLLPGETPLLLSPLKVKPISPEHKLEKASRLNYAMVYTVDYNVKVWFIGQIHRDSEYSLSVDYNRIHPPFPPVGFNPSQPSSNDSGYCRSMYENMPYSPGTSGRPRREARRTTSTGTKSVANTSYGNDQYNSFSPGAENNQRQIYQHHSYPHASSVVTEVLTREELSRQEDDIYNA